MKEKLQKYEDILNKMFDRVAPIALISSPFANMIALYLTFDKIELFRRIISWGIIIIFWGICFLHLVSMWKQDRANRRIFFKSGLVMFVFFCVYSVILITSRDSYVVRKFLTFVLYCVPVSVVAIDCGIYHKERILIKSGRIIGFIMMPGLILFDLKFWGLNLFNDGWNTFGGMSYLNLAYSILVILSFNIAGMYLKIESGKWEKFGSYILTVVCSVSLTVCGSRGALLGLALFLVMAAILFIWVKEGRKRMFFRCHALILLCVCMAIIAVPKDSVGIMRVIGLIDEIKQGDLEQAQNSQESNKIVDKIVEKAGEQSFDETVGGMQGESGIEENEEKQEKEKSEETYNAEMVEAIVNGSMSRVYLYKIAIRLANSNPILGSGPMAYQRMFKTYPHNVVLELAADFGYLATGLIVIFVIYLLINFLKKVPLSSEMRGGFLIMAALPITMMLSGDLYVSIELIWIMTYMFAVKLADKQNVKKIEG